MVNGLETIGMSLAAALAFIAQSAAQSAALVAAPVAAAAPAGAVEQVTASVTVLRPVRVVVDADGAVQLDSAPYAASVQRSRDAAGTVWIEFS